MKKILTTLFVLIMISPATLANEIVEDYFFIANNYKNCGKMDKALEYIEYILQIEPNNKDALATKLLWLPVEIDRTVNENQQPCDCNDLANPQDKPNNQDTISQAPEIRPPANITTNTPSETTTNEVSTDIKTDIKPEIVNKETETEDKITESTLSKNDLAKPKTKQNKKLKTTNKHINEEMVKKQNSKDLEKTDINDNVLPKQTNENENIKEINPQITIIESPKVNTTSIEFDSNYYNTKGKEFYEKRDFNTSIDYLKKAIDLNSKNFTAYNNLGMAFMMKNQVAEAEKALKKANSINKSYSQPLVNLSLVYRQMGDTQKQLAALDEAVKANKNDYWAYYLLGDYYKLENNYPKAISNYTESLKINSAFAQSYLALAICFFDTEEFTYSLKTLQHYITMKPDSAFAYSLKAKNERILGDLNSARDSMQYALSIDNLPEYRFELGKILYASEDTKESLDIFQSIAEELPSAELSNYMGLAYYKLRNIEKAIYYLNQAVELDGLRPIYYYNLAQCYKSLEDKRNYVKYINTATQITPIIPQDFIDISCIYYDNSNPNYAMNTINSGIEKFPNAKSLYLTKLKLLTSLGDNTAAGIVQNEINERFNKNEQKKKTKKRESNK